MDSIRLSIARYGRDHNMTTTDIHTMIFVMFLPSVNAPKINHMWNESELSYSDKTRHVHRYAGIES